MKNFDQRSKPRLAIGTNDTSLLLFCKRFPRAQNFFNTVARANVSRHQKKKNKYSNLSIERGKFRTRGDRSQRKREREKTRSAKWIASLCHIYIEYGPNSSSRKVARRGQEQQRAEIRHEFTARFCRFFSYLSLALFACRLSFSLCAFTSGSSSSSSALEQQLRNNNTRLIT